MKFYKDIDCTIEAKIGDPIAVIVLDDITLRQPYESKRPVLGEDIHADGSVHFHGNSSAPVKWSMVSDKAIERMKK